MKPDGQSATYMFVTSMSSCPVKPGMHTRTAARLKSALVQLNAQTGSLRACHVHAGRWRTVTASRNACGRPASSSARKHSGSWWMRSVMTEAASANRPPPKQAPRSKITRRQLYSSAWSSSCCGTCQFQRFGGNRAFNQARSSPNDSRTRTHPQERLRHGYAIMSRQSSSRRL